MDVSYKTTVSQRRWALLILIPLVKSIVTLEIWHVHAQSERERARSQA
ncbi:MAG TPA: hypothetical protein VN729_09760 [Ktedonobacteraceae bacterium]|nr:hypothetical protein [Ktedonobacteraceae bacterium]